MKRIIGYVSGTSNYGINVTIDNTCEINSYTYMDWDGDHDDRKNT